jgi:hypothetical protein
MQAQSVPLVIVALEEEDGFRRALPLVAAYVDQHYEPLAKIPVPDTKGLQIYIERGRRAADLDAATGWPCVSRSSYASLSRESRRARLAGKRDQRVAVHRSLADLLLQRAVRSAASTW